MPGSRRLLVLGLDAASTPLLKSWAADGTLPNIAGLMAAGLVGETCNLEGFEASTWPSFYTGVDPSFHGFYWLDQLTPGTYRRDHCTPASFARRKALWEVLSEAGHRVLVIDVPLTRLSPALNGTQVAEWGGHGSGQDSLFGYATTPAGLKQRIKEAVGDYPAPRACDVTHTRSLAEHRSFRDQLCAAAAARSALARKLLAEESWDFAIQIFGEAHCVGHQSWHLHDPRHPGYDAEVTRADGDPVRQVYAALDAAVGAILADLDPATTVVLFTLNGMAPSCGASILMPEILARLGATSLSGEERPGPSGALQAAYRRLPRALRLPLYNLRRRFRRRWLGQGDHIPFDPGHSQCFAIELGRTYAGIRLNLKGREPRGTLTPGAEAERFSERLIQDLLELRNAGTGQRVVQSVLRTAEHFSGPCVESMPDLVVVWDLEFRIGTTTAGNGAGAAVKVWSEKVGLVEGTNSFCRTGDHVRGGMFIARGPGIKPGTLDGVASILDLAPTFARMLGCGMPGVPGRPIPALLGAAV